MRILLSSYAFAPSIGGLETVSRLLAQEWSRAGCAVRIVTMTPAATLAEAAPEPWPIVRRPRWRELRHELRNCDVFFQNNLSLHLASAWPACPRPWITAHQTWLRHPGWPETLGTRAKAWATRLGTSVAISRAVADRLPVPAEIIPNPYDAGAFAGGGSGAEARALDAVFVGRLVSDKGADLFVAALAELARAGRKVTGTIVGEGPEETSLREMAAVAGLEKGRLVFAGPQSPEAVAALLRRHRVLVVPSRWPEPFGIVALEGIAAGCHVLVAESGGLPEAVGPCGKVFACGSLPALTLALASALDSPPPDAALARAHLARFQPEVIAGRYLRLFESVIYR